MNDNEILCRLSTYTESAPTPFGLATYLGWTITELKIHLKRNDQIGRALRYMLTEQLAFWAPRVSKSNESLINYIHILANEGRFND